MPIRNPFARRPGLMIPHEESIGSDSSSSLSAADPAHPGFERVDTVGSKASSALSVRSRRSQDTGEYKMSVVNDSGIYLPPSPTEKDSPWGRRYLSRTSTDTSRSAAAAGGDIDHFPISRESFDSYRRSFDISAKSPIIVTDMPRQSLDSARFQRLPRSALVERRFEREPPTPEEGFEEVGLNEEQLSKQQTTVQVTQAPAQPKKRSFFKFGSEHQDGAPTQPNPQGNTMSRFLPGRKREQSLSVTGSELGAMPFQADGPAAIAQEQEVQ